MYCSVCHCHRPFPTTSLFCAQVLWGQVSTGLSTWVRYRDSFLRAAEIGLVASGATPRWDAPPLFNFTTASGRIGIPTLLAGPDAAFNASDAQRLWAALWAARHHPNAAPDLATGMSAFMMSAVDDMVHVVLSQAAPPEAAGATGAAAGAGSRRRRALRQASVDAVEAAGLWCAEQVG